MNRMLRRMYFMNRMLRRKFYYAIAFIVYYVIQGCHGQLFFNCKWRHIHKTEVLNA